MAASWGTHASTLTPAAQAQGPLTVATQALPHHRGWCCHVFIVMAILGPVLTVTGRVHEDVGAWGRQRWRPGDRSGTGVGEGGPECPLVALPPDVGAGAQRMERDCPWGWGPSPPGSVQGRELSFRPPRATVLPKHAPSSSKAV